MSNTAQFDYWNGEAGKRWAADDERMARLLRPVTEALLNHAEPTRGAHALDIGCGGGSQSQLLAHYLGESGAVLGVDISAPLLDVAQQRQSAPGDATLSFLQADAAVADFDEGAFDLLFSRFGVMFFDDPAAAFANLRRALRSGGQLTFCCWRSVRENDWTWIPLQAALKHVAPPEPQPPNAPGPFAFADEQRLGEILRHAGFTEINIHSEAIRVSFGEADNLSENVREMAAIGPISRLLGEQEPAVLERVLEEIEAAVSEFCDGVTLRMPGSVWFVTATAP